MAYELIKRILGNTKDNLQFKIVPENNDILLYLYENDYEHIPVVLDSTISNEKLIHYVNGLLALYSGKAKITLEPVPYDNTA